MKNKNKLYGAILGDLAGQPYEFKYKGDYSEFNIHNPKSTFTDDTLMTLASAAYLLGDYHSAADAYRVIGRTYNGDFYGANFRKWLHDSISTIGDSWGNGCLMRISPFMYAENPLLNIIEATRCSHHSEISYQSIMKLYSAYINGELIYGHSHLVNKKSFKVEADSTIDLCLQYYDNNILSTRNMIEGIITLGGDTDTNASILGELNNYDRNDLNKDDIDYVDSKLDPFLLDILKRFNKKYE